MGTRLTNKNQRGFTLVELLFAIAIAGLITGGIAAAIMQVLTINTRASNHMIAVRQVQQAGKEVSKDALQAQNITYAQNPGFLLTMTWIEWGTNSTNEVTYTITEDNELQRSHNIDGTRVIAQYIDSEQTSCDPVGVLPDGSTLIFKVTATIGEASETRFYKIEPRPT